MFESLSERLGGILDRLTKRGALSEADVGEAMREVRRALIEADVALDVVRSFTDKVKVAGGRTGRHPLGHPRPDGRQDRPRPARPDAGRGGAGDRPQCAGAGGPHAGRPAGLGQDDDRGQDRPAAQRAQQAQGADGLARYAPAGGTGAAQGSGRAGGGRDAAHRRRPDAGGDRRTARSMRRASAATTWSSSIPPAAPISTSR